MASNQDSLRVTAVSADTKLLHDVSWMLTAVGYSVDTTRELEHNALWRRYADFDVLLLDARAVHYPYEPALACDSHNPVYRIFLYDPSLPPDFSAWQAAGANDGLTVPVSRGELLTRIRTAGRFLEFERRLQRWSTRSHIPDMYSRRGFLRQLSRLGATQPSPNSHYTLLATEIDLFRGIVLKGGQNAADRVVAAVARAIKSSAGEAAIAAYLDNGRFLTLLLPQSAALVKGIAERIANDFGCRESQRDSLGRPTLTTAVVPWSAGVMPDQLVGAGLEALTVAKQSGGDCIFMRGEYERELSAWTEEVANGNPFASVVAQDIMEYFPILLTCDQDQSAAIAALRRAGVPVCPYVDRNGRLTGVASAENAAGSDAANPSAALPIRKPDTINHNASFADIYEAFSTQGSSTLVVIADDHPLGYLTFHGFLSLVEPVGRETFTEVLAAGDDSRQLLVPSVSSDCEPE